MDKDKNKVIDLTDIEYLVEVMDKNKLSHKNNMKMSEIFYYNVFGDVEGAK